MVIPGNTQNPFEDYECKYQNTQNELADEKESLESQFRDSPRGECLKQALTDFPKIFNSIVTNYADTHNIISAVEKTLNDGVRLGIAFEKDAEKDMLINNILGVYFGTEIDIQVLREHPTEYSEVDNMDPRFPIVERLCGNPGAWLSIESMIDNNDNVSELTKRLSDDDEQYLEKNKEEFFEDFPKAKNISGAAISLLSKNYIKVPNEEGKYDKALDFSMAIKVSAYKLLQSLSVQINEKELNNIMKNIDSRECGQEYKGLQQLIKLVNSEKGKGKLKKDQSKRFDDKEKMDKKFVQEKYDSIKELLNDATQRRKTDIENQRKRMEKIKKQNQEGQYQATGGEIALLGGGEPDVLAQIDTVFSETKT